MTVLTQLLKGSMHPAANQNDSAWLLDTRKRGVPNRERMRVRALLGRP